MATGELEIEGTWEEILARASEFAGRRVRLTLLPTEAESVEEESLDPKHRRMLEAVRAIQEIELTDEERAILEGFEQFRKEHPFSLRQIEEEPCSGCSTPTS